MISLAAALILAPPREPSLVVVPDVQLSRTGDCASNQKVDLNTMLVLENKMLDYVDKGVRYRIVLQGENVTISNLSEPGPRKVSLNVGSEVDAGKDLDVELKLVILENALMVYWRETFQHKVYQQGLIKVSGDRLIFYCRGHGGFTSVD